MSGLIDQAPGFLDLGAWTNSLIIPLFQLFKNDNVAPALASSILLVAALLCVLFLIESFYIRAQISRRTRAIRLVSRGDFVDALPNIERRMLASGYLRHSWEKFRETLIEPTGSDPLSDRATPVDSRSIGTVSEVKACSSATTRQSCSLNSGITITS